MQSNAHHVINRGNNRAPVFFDDGDYAAFLKAIGDLKRRRPFEFYGYCLMPNHVHLLIRPLETPISRIMQSLLDLAHPALPPLSPQRRPRLAGAVQEPRRSRTTTTS